MVAATSLSVNPKRPDEVVAACGDFASPGHGLYKTRDGGATWQRLVRGLPVSFQGKGVLERSPSNPEILYASLGNSTELIFANDSVAGRRHRDRRRATAPPIRRTRASNASTPPRRCSGRPSWLLRSTDGGDSWETRNAIQDSDNTQGWYAGAVAVHPQDPDDLYLGYIGPNRSFDGGKTLEDMVVWKENRLLAQSVYDQENDSLIFVDFHAIRYAPGDPEIVYFACDQGVYRSADGGRTNERVNQGFNTAQFYRGVSISQRPASATSSPACRRTTASASSAIRASGAKPSGRSCQGWGQEAGFSAFDDQRGIGYFTTHTNRMLGPLAEGRLQDRRGPREDRCKPVIDPADAFDPCYIPDVNPFQRSSNCLDNTSWNAPLVLAPSKRNRLYAARDVVYRSDKAPEHSWSAEPRRSNPRERLHLERRARRHLGADQPRPGPRRQSDLRPGGGAEGRRPSGDRHRAALRPDERLPLAGRRRAPGNGSPTTCRRTGTRCRSSSIPTPRTAR